MFRERNGYIDTGKPVNVGTRCWSCNSVNYHATVSMEWCDDCGISFDYWGSHGNERYYSAERAKHAQEEEERYRRDQEERDAHLRYVNDMDYENYD